MDNLQISGRQTESAVAFLHLPRHQIRPVAQGQVGVPAVDTGEESHLESAAEGLMELWGDLGLFPGEDSIILRRKAYSRGACLWVLDKLGWLGGRSYVGMWLDEQAKRPDHHR